MLTNFIPLIPSTQNATYTLAVSLRRFGNLEKFLKLCNKVFLFLVVWPNNLLNENVDDVIKIVFYACNLGSRISFINGQKLMGPYSISLLRKNLLTSELKIITA